jgi:hypothetical protein
MLLLCMMLSMNAEAQSRSGDVTVNIRFLPVQTIAVKTSKKVTEPLYASTGDYEQGLLVIRDDHLVLFSSEGFQVSVTAVEDHFVIDTPIIESEDGGRELKLNIAYDNRVTGSEVMYFDKYIKVDGMETVYTEIVTYTITTR